MKFQRQISLTPGIETLFNEYLRFYGVTKGADEVKMFLINNLKLSNVVICSALNGDVEVGFCQSYIIPNSLSLNKMAIFNDLYVAESHRGEGIGKKLMEFNEKELLAIGVDRCELSTATGNKVAQDLYVREGWKIESEFHYFHKYIYK